MVRKYFFSMNAKVAVISIFFFWVLIGFAENFLLNYYLSITENGYYVPKESRYSHFVSTIMNEGSGGWWLYGQDQVNYYALSDKHHYSYWVLPRGSEPEGFSPTDKTTWGQRAVLSTLE